MSSVGKLKTQLFQKLSWRRLFIPFILTNISNLIFSKRAVNIFYETTWSNLYFCSNQCCIERMCATLRFFFGTCVSKTSIHMLDNNHRKNGVTSLLKYFSVFLMYIPTLIFWTGSRCLKLKMCGYYVFNYLLIFYRWNDWSLHYHISNFSFFQHAFNVYVTLIQTSFSLH